MSTPDEKAANRAKQKRFLERHPNYRPSKKKDPLLCRPQGGKFRTFELADPRDPDLLPRVVGHNWASVNPIWESLWSVRHWSHSKWASWLRELDIEGLRPVERAAYSIGRAIPIGRALAHDLVSLRLREINAAATGNPVAPPNWSLRNIEAIAAREQVLTAVACLRPDGSVSRYRSVAEAARENKIVTEVCLRNWIWAVSRDPHGNLWFDD